MISQLLAEAVVLGRNNDIARRSQHSVPKEALKKVSVVCMYYPGLQMCIPFDNGTRGGLGEMMSGGGGWGGREENARQVEGDVTWQGGLRERRSMRVRLREMISGGVG